MYSEQHARSSVVQPGGSLKARAEAYFRRILSGKITKWRIITTVQILDVLVIFLSSSACVYIYLAHERIYSDKYMVAVLTASLASQFIFEKFGLYDINVLPSLSETVPRLTKSWIVVFLTLALFQFFVRLSDDFSRAWAIAWFLSGYFLLLIERYIVGRAYRACVREGLFIHSVVIVGASQLAAQFIQRMKGNRFGIQVVGIFDDRNRENLDQVLGVRRLGGIDDLLQYSAANHVDTVIVAMQEPSETRLRSVIHKLREQPLNVRLLPGPLAFSALPGHHLVGHELPGVFLVPVSNRPISEASLLAKRAFDLMVALVALTLFSPVLLFAAIGIKMTSPGPVLFRQPRLGYKGNEFVVYKFRTMHVSSGADRLTERNDPRIHRLGAFLRKTSIDELPQLFNVLKGDMSLVGPRPHMATARAADKLYFDAVSDYAWRHRVKPGITGWAQVNGWRGPTETIEQIEKRVEYDLFYIENWSLALDFKILVMTAFVGFFGRNAF